MQHDHYLGPMYRSESPSDPAPGAAPVLFEAIVRTRCVEAMYNGGRVLLAPHVAFMKNDSLHVGALTIERDGKPPREAKIGVFKADGLVELKLTDRSFIPSPVFEPEDLRFVDTALLKVEPVAAA